MGCYEPEEAHESDRVEAPRGAGRRAVRRVPAAGVGGGVWVL